MDRKEFADAWLKTTYSNIETFEYLYRGCDDVSEWDEYRAKCLEASARALAIFYGRSDIGWETYVSDAIAAFDGLHGVAVVIPIEKATSTVRVTAEMIDAGIRHRNNTQGGLADTFAVMAKLGDLTKPAEKP